MKITSLTSHTFLILSCVFAISRVYAAEGHQHHAVPNNKDSQTTRLANTSLANTSHAVATDHVPLDHTQMDHTQMDHSQMNHTAPDASVNEKAVIIEHPEHPEHPVQKNIVLRNPDYSDGRQFAMGHAHVMAGEQVLYGGIIDQLGIQHVLNDNLSKDNVSKKNLTKDNLLQSSVNSLQLVGQFWVGTDSNRAVLKTNINHNKNTTHSNIDLAWRKPISPYWNIDLGWKNTHVMQHQKSQNWFAASINGIAPYWFNIDATLQTTQHGLTGLVVDAGYDARLTQTIWLEPHLGISAYSTNNAQYNIGAGLSEVEYGLRLRYSPKRKSGIYIGIQSQQLFGNTKQLAQKNLEHVKQHTYSLGYSLVF